MYSKNKNLYYDKWYYNYDYCDRGWNILLYETVKNNVHVTLGLGNLI